MKTYAAIALLGGWTWSWAADPGNSGIPPLPPMPPVPQQAPNAWLGLQLSKPDAAMAANVPSLPQGVGFVVRSVDAKGPGEVAGLRPMDLLWKLGDQLLVNEGQLATLLRLSKPSDEIRLLGFRDGKPLEVSLKLGQGSGQKRSFPVELVDSALLSAECAGPMRVVNVADRMATYSTDDGRAVVQREGDLTKVSIHGAKGELIYQGELPADGSVALVPERWQRRIQALRRGLDHALDGRMMPPRQPRPRVVPPTAQNP